MDELFAILFIASPEREGIYCVWYGREDETHAVGRVLEPNASDASWSSKPNYSGSYLTVQQNGRVRYFCEFAKAHRPLSMSFFASFLNHSRLKSPDPFLQSSAW